MIFLVIIVILIFAILKDMSRGDKMKNTLLYDFMEIFKSINCDSLYCNCNDCSNKKLCDTVEDVIKSIGDLYNEKK